MNKQKSFIWVLFFVLLLIPIRAHADSNELTITPLSIDGTRVTTQELTLSTEKQQLKHDLKISITNFSSSKKELILTGANPFTTNDGKISYGQHKLKDAPFSFPDVVKSNTISINGQETKVLTVPITFPKTITGDLIGAIQLASKTDDDKVFIPITVTGKPSAQPNGIKLEKLIGKVITDMPALGLHLVNSDPRFIEDQNIDLTLTYKEFFGLKKRVWRFAQQEVAIAPYSFFDLLVSLQGDRLKAGEYEVQGTISNGAKVFKVNQKIYLDGKEATRINQQAKNVRQDPFWLIILAIMLIVALIAVVIIAFRQNAKGKRAKRSFS